jgi:hypothetical protein
VHCKRGRAAGGSPVLMAWPMLRIPSAAACWLGCGVVQKPGQQHCTAFSRTAAAPGTAQPGWGRYRACTGRGVSSSSRTASKPHTSGLVRLQCAHGVQELCMHSSLLPTACQGLSIRVCCIQGRNWGTCTNTICGVAVLQSQQASSRVCGAGTASGRASRTPPFLPISWHAIDPNGLCTATRFG